MEGILGSGLITLLVATVLGGIQFWMLSSKVPTSVKWVGLRKESLAKSRACLREITAGLRTLKLGYNEYNRKGHPCVIPDPGFRPIVLVPQEHIEWMINEPDNVLSMRETQIGRFAIRYLAPTVDPSHDQFMMGAVRKDLTRNLGKLQGGLVQDMREAIDATMGLDEGSWNEVCVWTAMQTLISRSTYRAFVGSPLCYNMDFLSYSQSFTTWLGGGAVIVGQYMPWIMKPLFGYLGAIPVYYYKRKSYKFIVPLIRERMSNIKQKRANPDFDFEEPMDLITWMVTAILDEPGTSASKPEDLASKLLFFILGAIHATVMTATNTMLDLASSDPNRKFCETLREEAALVLKTEQDWSDSSNLAKLPCTDSTIRESLRTNPVLTRVMLQEVVQKTGVDLPSGHHLPKGAWIGAQTMGLHHDERFYPKPEEYDPFRFARKPEDVSNQGDNDTLTEKATIYRKNQGLSTASDIFLAFGLGRHACPGRWLVAHQLKLMLAYITLNYDIQPMAKRPLNRVFGDNIIPSQTATIMVRRRKQA